jgi:hypothetical protein
MIEEIQERLQNRASEHKNGHHVLEKNFNGSLVEKQTAKINIPIHENLHLNSMHTAVSGGMSFSNDRRQSISVAPVGRDALRELVRNRITSRNSNHQ